MSGPKNPEAFPTGNTMAGGNSGGMTLRDWFAGQALGATLTAMANRQHGMKPGKSVETTAAEDSYAIADAMLAAREREA